MLEEKGGNPIYVCMGGIVQAETHFKKSSIGISKRQNCFDRAGTVSILAWDCIPRAVNRLIANHYLRTVVVHTTKRALFDTELFK